MNINLDFIVAGAHKCGTTSIDSLLRSHPGIEMAAIKEPHYWLRQHLGNRLDHGVWDPRVYEGLWSASPGHLRGETSVYYVAFAREFLDELARNALSPKVVVMIRHSIERAYSGYHDVVLKSGLERAGSFDEMVSAQLAGNPYSLAGRHSPALCHLALGFYSRGLEEISRELGSENLKVILLEDLQAAPERTLSSLCEFLGTDYWAGMNRPGWRENQGGLEWSSSAFRVAAQSRIGICARRGLKRLAPNLHGELVSRVKARYSRSVPPMSSYAYQALWELYGDDSDELRALLGRDLSGWPTSR